MVFVTKSANKTEINEGEDVEYTYTVYHPVGSQIHLTEIQDDIYGTIWAGDVIILGGSSYEVKITKYPATTTTNKARANFYDISPPGTWTEWSAEVTVTLSEWKDIAQAVNTKEDLEVLNGLMQGNRAWEEAHTLRCVKMSKVIDLI